MRAFYAITKQTIRASVRSRVFHVLLVLTLLAVFLLPLTVSGDGTLVGELQISLTYSLQTVTTLLSVAALWLGCAGLSREIEAYNIHLVLTKPVPGWLLWLGKWFGIFLMTAVIFLISSAIIYVLVRTQVGEEGWSREELETARSEVLVGRRRFKPLTPDFEQLGRQRYSEMKKAGELAPGHDPQRVISELTRQIKASSTEVGPARVRAWRFSGVRVSGPEQRLFVRYRLYVASTTQSKQRFTEGIWAVVNPADPEVGRTGVLPQRVMGGSFHEFSFPGRLVSDRGRVILQYENRDRQGQSVIFQTADGPALLTRVTGFGWNYVRGTAIVLLCLALFAAIGCVFGAAFSAPVAVFVAIAYVVLGLIVDPTIGEPTRGAAGEIMQWNPLDMVAWAVSRAVDYIVVSFDTFNVSFPLARGYLIEFAKIGNIIVFDVLLRGIPLVLLGMWVLSRRELGKVIRR